MTQYFGVRLHSISDAEDDEAIASRDSPDSIAFSADDRLLVYVGRNPTGRFSQILRVRDLTARLELASLSLKGLKTDPPSLPDTDQSVKFSPNSRYVAIRSGGKVTLVLWPTADLIEAVCATVGRNLLPAEWDTLVGDGVPYQLVCTGLPSPVYKYPGISIRNQIERLRAWLWL